MAMAQSQHVKELHDLHVWELAPGHPILTAPVLVARDVDCYAIRREIERMLKDRFKIRTQRCRSTTRRRRCCRFSDMGSGPP